MFYLLAFVTEYASEGVEWVKLNIFGTVPSLIGINFKEVNGVGLYHWVYIRCSPVMSKEMLIC